MMTLVHSPSRFTLTDNQQVAKDAILEGLNERGDTAMSLQGYAGTGKTTLLGSLLDELRSPVFVTAPTHKAAQVLGEKTGYIARTIHSLLRLKVVRDRKGGYTLVQDLDRGMPPRVGTVIVDEASMIGQDLRKHILPEADLFSTPSLQWLFVGDPAQLPPVNEAPSPALSMPGPTLTQVVRQAEGNPILDVATRVRIGKPYFVEGFHGGVGVVLTSKPHALLESITSAFLRGDDARVLCYRNATVAEYNHAIRTAIHGNDVPRFIQGDRLMVGETYHDRFKTPLLQNSEEVTVLETGIDDMYLVGRHRFRAWLLKLQPDDRDSVWTPVLHEDDKLTYAQALEKEKLEARRTNRWNSFYELKEAFARVQPAYAMTVHKSQGSTFHTAYVDHRDLMTCRGEEFQSLVYVAVTRPSHRLGMLV